MLTMLKTEVQIINKIKSLKKKLSKKKKIYENFGDKEQRQLDDFIGDYYAYDCSNRSRTYRIVEEFSDWCGTYNILEK